MMCAARYTILPALLTASKAELLSLLQGGALACLAAEHDVHPQHDSAIRHGENPLRHTA